MIKELSQDIRKYIQLNWDYAKLEGLEVIVKVSSFLLISIITIIMLSIMILLLSLGLSAYLGELMDSAHLGYFIIGGVYVLLGGIIFLFRKQLLTDPILRLILKQIAQDNTQRSQNGQAHLPNK